MTELRDERGQLAKEGPVEDSHFTASEILLAALEDCHLQVLRPGCHGNDPVFSPFPTQPLALSAWSGHNNKNTCFLKVPYSV